MTVYGIYSSNLNSPEFEPIEREMGPILVLSSKIYQTKNYLRIETFTTPDKGKLTQEQQRLIWLNYTILSRKEQFKS
jgi:peptidyl-dipeptidase Dcp